jgi:hypothetical protein
LDFFQRFQQNGCQRAVEFSGPVNFIPGKPGKAAHYRISEMPDEFNFATNSYSPHLKQINRKKEFI